MERVGILYVHLAYFTTIRYILWSFGIFHGLLGFFPFWYNVSIKIWQPCMVCQSHVKSPPHLLRRRGPEDATEHRNRTSPV
jgi:hypothetical protein